MPASSALDPSLILYWLTHRVEIRRVSLRSAVEGLLPDDCEDDPKVLTNTLRRRLIELGHADIGEGADGYDFLRILPPYLILLSPHDEEREALLCGSRTPKFLSEIENAIQNQDILLRRESLKDAPERITLYGDLEAIRQIASEISLPLIEQASERMIIQSGVSWVKRLESTPHEPEPSSTQCEYWNWSKREWLKGLPRKKSEGDLLRLTVGYGIRPFLVRHKGRLRKILSEAEAKCVSAGILREKVVCYEADKETLTISLRLPTELSRPLCLCTGSVPQNVSKEFVVYEEISDDMAYRWSEAFGLSMTITGKIANGDPAGKL